MHSLNYDAAGGKSLQKRALPLARSGNASVRPVGVDEVGGSLAGRGHLLDVAQDQVHQTAVASHSKLSYQVHQLLIGHFGLDVAEIIILIIS